MTGVLEENTRTFTDNWTGTGAIENVGGGDTERIALEATEYMVSEVVVTGSLTTELLQNNYVAGDTVILKYRHGADEATCLAAEWVGYTVPFKSAGYVQVRIEATA